jgi:uncharacterized repeat protein (TIGR03803 family)
LIFPLAPWDESCYFNDTMELITQRSVRGTTGVSRTFILLAAMLLAACSQVCKAQDNATLTVMVNFDGTNGAAPWGSLMQATDGYLYGVAQSTQDQGTVFQMTLDGLLTNLARFHGTNGTAPVGHLLQGSDGNFYGMTAYGGAYPGGEYNLGLGTVFRMTLDGTLTTLASFDGTNGYCPRGWLVEGPDRSFYGTTTCGGSAYSGSRSLYGTVFRITPGGVLTTLVSFDHTNGAIPFDGLVLGKDGNFYGTVDDGGDNDSGGVFKLTGGGLFTPMVWLTNGASPMCGLVQTVDGDLYGGTSCGPFGPRTNDTIFKVSTNGTLTTVARFNGANGTYPCALVQGTDGNLYGVTRSGGPSDVGTVFRVTPDGTLTTLASFGGTNGDHPWGIIQAGNGAFYGTTAEGGTFGLGTIFRLSVPGADAPRIQSATAASGVVTLSWIALMNRTYQLQYKTNLSQTNWLYAGSPFKATNSFTTASDSVGSDPQRFYRVALLP